MAITPMDLQVLFMQEPAAAKEADKRRRMEETRQTRLASLTKYRSNNPSVQSTEATAEGQQVNAEGGGGGTRYRRREQDEESDQPEERVKEEGKGDVVDFEA